MLKSLLLLTFISASFCGTTSIRNKNKSMNLCFQNDGFPVNLGEMPYLVLIYTKQSCKSDFCTGTIINPNWIITSAFCLYGRKTARVYGGVIDVDKLDEAEFMSGDISSDHFMIHPAYKHRSGRFNIALLHVCVSIRRSQYVSIANLPLKSDELINGQPAVVAGFKTTSHEGMANGDLRETKKQVGGMCDDFFEEGSYLPEQHLCLKSTMNTSCISDYGGGITMVIDGREALHGIFNYFAEQGCDKNFPDVYTRISSFINWILTTIGIEEEEDQTVEEEEELKEEVEEGMKENTSEELKKQNNEELKEEDIEEAKEELKSEVKEEVKEELLSQVLQPLMKPLLQVLEFLNHDEPQKMENEVAK